MVFLPSLLLLTPAILVPAATVVVFWALLMASATLSAVAKLLPAVPALTVPSEAVVSVEVLTE